MDAQPRWKNGHPPHRTTGLATINSAQPRLLPGRRCWMGMAGRASLRQSLKAAGPGQFGFRRPSLAIQPVFPMLKADL